MMRATIHIIAMLLMLQACTGLNGSLDLRKPASLDLTPPEGPPEYEQGWIDGCESGMNAYSNTFYKWVRTFEYRQDPVLRHNKMYYQVWKDAFLYCSIFLETVNRERI